MKQRISCYVDKEKKDKLYSIVYRDGISQSEVLKRGIDIQYNKRYIYTTEELKKRLNALDDILTIINYTNMSNDDKMMRIKNLCDIKRIKKSY